MSSFEKIFSPIHAAHYAKAYRSNINRLAVKDLDSAQNIWGQVDQTYAFKNILVGSPQSRRDIWQSWTHGGVIEFKDRPAFYILCQKYWEGDVAVSRWAVLGSLPLDSKAIKIHEDVVAEGVERARQATEACEADLAPIFVGYEESYATKIRELLRGLVSYRAPLLSFSESDSTQNSHTIWEINENMEISKIEDAFKGLDFFLLDGHHRLAAAKSNAVQGLGDGKILACICSMSHEDTAILPIHRVINHSNWILADHLVEDWSRCGCRVEEVSSVKPADIDKLLTQKSLNTLECFFLHAHSNVLWRLVFDPTKHSVPYPLSSMPLAHLELCLEKYFNGATVIPVADSRFALEQLAHEQAQVAFFLRPADASIVKEVARLGKRMPRKSTRFVPKPALGLIMRPWR